MKDAEQPAILGHGKRGAAGLRDSVGNGMDLARDIGAHRGLQGAHCRTDRNRRRIEEVQDRVNSALANPGA